MSKKKQFSKMKKNKKALKKKQLKVYDFLISMFPTPEHCLEFISYLLTTYFEEQPPEAKDGAQISYKSMLIDFANLFRVIHPNTKD